MAKGFKHGAGGGAALNFKVAGGTERPADPKENTIWVNTGRDITGWVFSTTEPAEPVEGMVWVVIDTRTEATFNALKKNVLMVYPISARQYVSGAWAKKEGELYQQGGWKLLDDTFYLFNYGDAASVTGGWTASGEGAYGYAGGIPGIEENEDGSLRIYQDGNYFGRYYANNLIDLTEFSKICFEGVFPPVTSYELSGLRVWSKLGGSIADKQKAAVFSTINGYAELDISNLTGLQYIVLTVAERNTEVIMKKLWLE